MPGRDSATRTPRDILKRETGHVIKDWGGRLPVALIYPNSYYLGMSNLGIHAIYRLLNDYDDVVCERFFWERDKAGKNAPLLSIESGRPLRDFSVLAFSISYELDYFNVVPVLKAAGIPEYAADRDERHPLVITGGPCITANPMPLLPFFDCFCIGEAEPILPAMLPDISEGLNNPRVDLMKALTDLPGIYAPSQPRPKPVTRQWVKDLDEFPVNSVVLTPDTELGDLFLMEVERGCQRGCRFCLVNCIFSPMRFRNANNLIELSKEGLKHRKRIGLVGPAVTDHPDIPVLLDGLLKSGASLSISSLRINSLSGEIIDNLAQGNVRTITVAPEAGSARLRHVINKDISQDDILRVADSVGKRNFKILKLYFMIGLPTETGEDIEELVNLALAVKTRLDKHRGNTRLNLNVAPFVPKAGTPFQWLPMASLDTLTGSIDVLKKQLPAQGIILKTESPAWSRIQGVLSRGDSRISLALARIDRVSLAAWRKAIKEYELDTDYYIDRKWDTSQDLPWSIIDTTTDKDKLRAEMDRALKTGN
jgi:radical SAM superfamily enzyme YgiQ (UPF0313 family)